MAGIFDDQGNNGTPSTPAAPTQGTTNSTDLFGSPTTGTPGVQGPSTFGGTGEGDLFGAGPITGTPTTQAPTNSGTDDDSIELFGGEAQGQAVVDRFREFVEKGGVPWQNFIDYDMGDIATYLGTVYIAQEDIARNTTNPSIDTRWREFSAESVETVDVDFENRELTVTVNGISGSAQLPVPDPTTVTLSFADDTNTLTVDVDGVTATVVIPDTAITQNDLSWDAENNNLTSTVNGQTGTVNIPFAVEEYRNNVTYPAGELVRDPNDATSIFISRIDNNLGNALPRRQNRTDAAWFPLGESFGQMTGGVYHESFTISSDTNTFALIGNPPEELAVAVNGAAYAITMDYTYDQFTGIITFIQEVLEDDVLEIWSIGGGSGSGGGGSFAGGSGGMYDDGTVDEDGQYDDGVIA